MATWPSPPTLQVMSPNSPTIWSVQMMTRRPSTIQTSTVSLTSHKTTHDNTGWFGVRTVCETSVSQIFRGDCVSERKQRKPDSGNRGQAEDAGSMSRRRSRRNSTRIHSHQTRREFFFVNEISEKTSNEELNKQLLVKIQLGESSIRLSTTWRCRIQKKFRICTI